MPPALPTLLPAAQAVAQRRGWTGLASQLTALAAPPAALQIVLAPGTTWPVELLPCPPEVQTPLPAVQADPLPVVCAARVVLVFPCGRLLTAEEIRWLQQVILNRPAASYAILLTGTEVMESEADLAAVERIARGALIASGTSRPVLAQHGVYLWGTAAAPWLQARLDRDRAAFTAWWQSPPADLDSLLVYRTGYGLEAALSAARHATPPAAGPDGALSSLLNELEEVRLQMLERWQPATAHSERQLDLLLATLEQSLLQGWEPYMHRCPDLRRRRPLSSEALGRLVYHYLTGAVQEWESQFAQSLQGQIPAILLNLTEDIENRADWAQVNRWLEAGAAAPYPGVFLALAAPEISLAAPQPGAVLPPLHMPPSPPLLGTAAQMALGGGAAALATGLLTASIPLALLAGGATAGAIGSAQPSDSPAARWQACEQFGRQLIQQAVQSMRTAARQQLHAGATALQRRLEAEWTTLLTALRRVRQTASSAAAQDDADLEQLTALYACLVALSSGDGAPATE